jgi:hypothetical protein
MITTQWSLAEDPEHLNIYTSSYSHDLEAYEQKGHLPRMKFTSPKTINLHHEKHSLRRNSGARHCNTVSMFSQKRGPTSEDLPYSGTDAFRCL